MYEFRYRALSLSRDLEVDLLTTRKKSLVLYSNIPQVRFVLQFML